MSGMKLAPVRTMGDFVLDSKRYLPPAFNDLKRFNNRVTSNLLYYQTNYIGLSVVIFLLFILFGFNKIIVGGIGYAITAATALFAMDRIPQAKQIRAQYPVAVIGLGVVDAILIYSAFRSILYITLALLVPIALSIIHAAMRSRGIKNKVSNKMEQMGASVYANSPMGVVLAALGFETKDFEE